MSKTLKKVGVVLGAVALIATGVGAVLPLGGAILGTTFTAIGTIAGVASGIANVASNALTKTSRNGLNSGVASGTVTQVLIAADAPRPYPMGEGHFAGVMRHREGYGGTVDGVENPYWLEVTVYSGVGPVQAITPQIDFDAIPAWYSGYLTTDTQLGAVPEASALTASFGTPDRWTASHKLSGHAAIAWNYLFDKAGKKFASGFPLTGATGQWNLVYDPRQDDTFPGGAGDCRLGDESTYVWDGLPGDAIPAGENPALHAGTYAYGRYVEGTRVMGMGLPAEGIDFTTIAAWANVCETNEWRIFGVAFEGGDADDQLRWSNLKDIAAAGGGEPGFAGAVLSFLYDAPLVALDTVTEADVSDAMAVTYMQSWRDVIGTVIPEFTSPDHNWEMTKAESVTLPGVDGITRTWPFRFVKVGDQAAQLATYKALNSQEFHPIQLRGMPRLRNYRPGDCLHLSLPRLGLDVDAVLLERGPIDPVTMERDLVLRGETPAKHAYALGLSATLPPAPALGQTPQQRDETAAGASAVAIVEVAAIKTVAVDPVTYAVQGDQLPAYILPKVTRGGADIRGDDLVHYAIATSGLTATVEDTDGDPDKGLIEITAVDALSGFIDLTVTVGGVDYPAKRIVVEKRVAGGEAPGGVGTDEATWSSFSTINGTTYAVITPLAKTVTVAGGQTLHGVAPLDYYVGGTTFVSRLATAKWQYSPTGAGTWSDFGTGIDGDYAAIGGYEAETGHGEFSHDKAGLSAGDYDIRLVAKLNGSGDTVTFVGTATISVS